MDWGRALAAIIIALLINIQLVAAGLWPPLEMRVKLAELAPQTLNPEIYEIFSEDQVRWMLSVWNSPSKYVIVDKQGRAWTVGQGEMPAPLRAALYNQSLQPWIVAQAGSSVGFAGWAVKVIGSDGSIERWYVRKDSPIFTGTIYVVDSDTVLSVNDPEGGTYTSPKAYNSTLPKWFQDKGGISVYFGASSNPTNVLIYSEVGGTVLEWKVHLEAHSSSGATTGYGLYLGFVFDSAYYVAPARSWCYVRTASGESNTTSFTVEDNTLYRFKWVWCSIQWSTQDQYADVVIHMEWPSVSGTIEYQLGEEAQSESQPPPPPPPGELPKDTTNNTVCSIEPLSGSSLPIVQSGQIGGNGGTQVDWIIAKNLLSPKWPGNTTDLDDYWRAAVGWSWSTVEPQTCDFSFFTEYGSELDLVDESFVFDWSGWPAFRHSEVLPDQSGDYVYIWMVRLDYNHTRYIYIAYTNVTINAAGEGNRLVRAIKNAFGSALSALIALAKKIMPDELEHLGGYAWQYFKQIKDLFAQLFNYLPWLANVVQLLIFLMPTVIVAILVYDPFRVVEFFRWVFRMILEVVQFIRSLLPIP
jgi:hypothetical protein